MRAAAAPIMLVGLALALAATASAAPLDTKNSVKLQSPSEASAFERELIRRSLLQAKNYPMTKIVAKTELEEAEFGTSVAMAGAYYAAGAPGSSLVTSPPNGAVYYGPIPGINGATADAQKKIDTPTGAGQGFGTSLAMHKDASGSKITLVVGDPENTNNAGKAFIYTIALPALTVTGQPVVLTPPKSRGYFGQSVAISEDYVVVGAPRSCDTQDTSSFSCDTHGTAYVYSLTGALIQELYPTNSNSDYDRFGTDVSVSGDYIAVGAPEDSSMGDNTGYVQVYKKTNATHFTAHQKFEPVITTNNPTPKFGSSVSVSSTHVLIGAPSYSKTSATTDDDYGRAHLYKLDGTLVKSFVASDGASSAYFGSAVELSGNFVAVTAPGASAQRMPGRRLLGNLLTEGAAYVFESTDGFATYTPTKYYATDPDGGAQFGSSIAVDGEYVITGARQHDVSDSTEKNEGAAYVSYIRYVSTNSGDSCSCSALDDQLFIGDCSGLAKKTDKFCGDSIYCCAKSSTDCCEANGGAIAGIVIGLAVFLALAITGCAYCCKCCCFKKPPVPAAVVMVPQGGVQMAQAVVMTPQGMMAQPMGVAQGGVQMAPAPTPAADTINKI